MCYCEFAAICCTVLVLFCLVCVHCSINIQMTFCMPLLGRMTLEARFEKGWATGFGYMRWWKNNKIYYQGNFQHGTVQSM